MTFRKSVLIDILTHISRALHYIKETRQLGNQE
jgi:hypothetical protein